MHDERQMTPDPAGHGNPGDGQEVKCTPGCPRSGQGDGDRQAASTELKAGDPQAGPWAQAALRALRMSLAVVPCQGKECPDPK